MARTPRVAAAIADGGRRTSKLDPAIALALESRRALDAVRDYVATFTKRERIRNRLVEHTMLVKIRETPFSVYLRFKKPYKGREVIYVAGRNGGHLLAHGTGLERLAGTLRLHPESKEAKKENRYPIHMLGMRVLVEQVIAQWEAARNVPDVKVTYYPHAKLGERECLVIETTFPVKRPGVKFHRTRLYIDKQTKFPVRVEQYDFPKRAKDGPPLVEEYTYFDIRVNVGLTDRDFDPQNPEYDF